MEDEPMKRMIICIIGIAFFVLPVVSACSAEKQARQGSDAKTLFEKKCSTCHSIDKPKSQKKTQTEWIETVMRMKNKNGAPVNDEEAKAITEHLAKNYGT
jgi:mono/diheme cytochrome c family protein